MASPTHSAVPPDIVTTSSSGPGSNESISGSPDTPETPANSLVEESATQVQESLEKKPPPSTPASYRPKKTQHIVQHPQVALTGHGNLRQTNNHHHQQQQHYPRPHNHGNQNLQRHTLPSQAHTPAVEVDPTSIYVGKIGSEENVDLQEVLTNIFGKHGQVADVRVFQHTHNPWHFAFIKFNEAPAVDSALKEDGIEVCGGCIQVRRKKIGLKRHWRNPLDTRDPQVNPNLQALGTNQSFVRKGPASQQSINKSHPSPSCPVTSSSEVQRNDNYQMPQWVNNKIEMASTSNNVERNNVERVSNIPNSQGDPPPYGYGPHNGTRLQNMKHVQYSWTTQPSMPNAPQSFWPLNESAPLGPPLFSLDRSNVLPSQPPSPQTPIDRTTPRQLQHENILSQYSPPAPLIPFYVDPATGIALQAGRPIPPFGILPAFQPLPGDFAMLTSGAMPVIMMPRACPVPVLTAPQQSLQSPQTPNGTLSVKARISQSSPKIKSQGIRQRKEQQRLSILNSKICDGQPTPASKAIVFGDFTETKDGLRSSEGAKNEKIVQDKSGQTESGQTVDRSPTSSEHNEKIHGRTQAVANVQKPRTLSEERHAADQWMPSYSASDIAHYQRPHQPIYLPRFIDWAHGST